jgi:hypothetical protein
MATEPPQASLFIRASRPIAPAGFIDHPQLKTIARYLPLPLLFTETDSNYKPEVTLGAHLCSL